MTLTFLLTAFVVAASPGTGVLFTLAAGLGGGRRASVVAAFGCTLGIVPHVAAALLGLAAVLHASALAFEVVKYLGVAYLLYMAWMTLRDRGTLALDQAAAPRPALAIIGQAVLVNLLNPKLSIFFLAFLPQFVAPGEARPLLAMAWLSAAFMLVTFVVFVGYGLGAAAIRDRLIARPRIVQWMRRTFAGAFLALGVKLALTER